MCAKKAYAATSKKKRKRIVFIVMVMGSPLPFGDSPFSEKGKKEEEVKEGEES
ncbi:MAG TPA: hypothetical protein VNS58_16245 [Puia sp.]|jgi:hypothetical protein|nr:hypothetical protein [Puia sp.]